MKKLNFIYMLSALFLALLSCNTNSKSDIAENSLTESDSTLIVNKIMEATDMFANANNKLDTEGILNFWHYNNPDFIIFENTTIHPTGEELEKGVIEFYAAGIDSTNLNWTKREVLPLSKEFAHLIGEYNFYLKLKSGEVMNYHVFYSALFKEIDGEWKALRVHESYAK